MMQLKNLKSQYNNYAKLRLLKIPYEQIHMVKSATNLQDLENIVKAYPKYDWHVIEQEIIQGKEIINKFNTSGKQIEIYKTKGYSNIKLEKMDSQNYISHLLVSSPTTKHPHVWGRLLNKSIETIKKELQLVNTDGQNYILHNYKEFTYNHLILLIEALNMYEEQIERQYELVNNIDTNLLKVNFLEKKNIVLNHYKDIIDYLVTNNSQSLFWDELTEPQRKLYLSSTKSYGNKVKNKLANYIAHYTTLPELEELDNGNMKVLSRFKK